MIESISEFESFVDGLKKRYREIKVSNLVFKNTDHTIGELTGEIEFENDIRLNVSEKTDFSNGKIEFYRYEVYQGKSLLYWYDPHPHPDDRSIAITFPHHKHIYPNIEQHRVPAPGLGFTTTNLIFLIEEIINNLVSS